MADDSSKQVIGTVGGAVSCFIFWTTATIANDRLLSHLERRYYGKNNTNNNTTQNPGQQQQQPSSLGLSSTGVGSGLSRFLSGRNKISWAKDNRLLFYLLAIWCSITYSGLILTMLLASYNPNSSIADLGSFFSVATYLSMIVMVFWTVLEGVETVKRLGIYNQNQMPSRTNNTTTIATNGNSGRRKSRQGTTKKKSGNIRSSIQQKKSGNTNTTRGSQIQQQSTLPNEAASSEDVSAFSMSHPTGSELQGEDDDDENDVVDNMNNNYGGAGESGLSGGDEDDSHYYNDSYHNNAGDYGVVYNGHPDDAEAWLPSTSEQNDSFYDDSYGAALDDNDDGFGSIAGQSANNNTNIAGGTRSSVTNSVSTHNNSRTKGINVSSNNMNGTTTNNGNNTTTVNTLPGNTSSSGRLSQNSHNIVAMSTNSTFVSNGYRNNNNNQNDNNTNNEDACCSSDDFCDPWEHRGFISLCTIFVLYFIFNMTEQSLKTMDGVDYKIGQWGSVVMSFIIAMVCIFQSVNTYQSFKNTSQDLAFLFVSIFGTLAFFLILRTIMVFPPVQESLGKFLTVACIPNCDAVSMLFLLLRVPRAK